MNGENSTTAIQKFLKSLLMKPKGILLNAGCDF